MCGSIRKIRGETKYVMIELLKFPFKCLIQKNRDTVKAIRPDAFKSLSLLILEKNKNKAKYKMVHHLI